MEKDITILMPCLNKEENIAFCIDQAQSYISSRGLTAEILVVDNDSTDRSAEIAAENRFAGICERHKDIVNSAFQVG